MTKPSPQSIQCCSLEKPRLVEAFKKCDMCTTTYEAFHQCYRNAARESGRRARSCMVA